MKILFFTIICVLTCLQNYVELKKETSSSVGNGEKRQFTKEWQQIGDDEAVPAGLHIRINLATGKKEAKLIDRDENADTSVALVKDAEIQEDNTEKTYLKSDLEERLKHIPEEELLQSLEVLDSVKKQFRSYEELKKDFESLKMSVKTDLEVMEELFASYQKVMEKQKKHTMEELGNLNILSPIEESHLNILTDLEYMVHQVDNAREFVLSEGLTLIVYPSLNSSSSVIRTEAARLLGSAVQNNPASQIKALESGAVGTLLRVLALDPAASVRSAALFALSCQVRRFPLAQRQFVDEGGLAVLASLFDGESGEQLKLQVKIVTFVDDLLVERQDAKLSQIEASGENSTLPENTEALERLRQYKLIDLDKILYEQQWCQHLVKLFKRELLSKSTADESSLFGENSDNTPDLDAVEKLTKAMVSLAEPCRTEFLSDQRVVKLILGLIEWLKKLSEEEEGETDGYYTSLADQVKLLGFKLNVFHKTYSIPQSSMTF